jgi:hypothetical protein
MVMVDLEEVDLKDLIQELNWRGYAVFDDEVLDVDSETIEILVELIDNSNPRIGSKLYFARKYLTEVLLEVHQ